VAWDIREAASEEEASKEGADKDINAGDRACVSGWGWP
jgi:hypothetical protein